MDFFKIINKNNGFKRYFFNASWLFSEKILKIFLVLIVEIYVIRFLGPERFGVYSYVLAFAGLFGVIAKLGMDEIAVRELVNNPEKNTAYLGSIFWLKIAGAFITLIAITITIIFTPDTNAIKLYILIISFGFIFQSFEVIDYFFQAKVLSKYVSICKLIQLLITSSLKLYFIYIKADILWFILVSLIEYIVLAIMYSIMYKFKGRGAFLKSFDTNIAKKMLKNSWPLILASMMIVVYMRIDQIMIKAMLGNKEAGLYSSVVRLSESWYFIPTIITGSLFPAILNAKDIDDEFYYKRMQRLYDLMLWIGIIIAVPVSIFSKYIMLLLYGQEYVSAYNVLSVHIWVGVFVGLGCASGKWLVAENLQIISTFNTISGAAMNVALNFVLIPRIGIMGAAVATIISYGFAVFLFLIFSKKTRKNLFLLLNTVNPLRFILIIKKLYNK